MTGNQRIAVRIGASLVTSGVIYLMKIDRSMTEKKQSAVGSCPISRVAGVPDDRQLAEFDRKIRRPNQLVVVLFSSETCEPCQRTSLVIESARRQFASQPVIFDGVDVDKYPLLASASGVTRVPDLRFYRDGNQVGSLTGVPTSGEIEAKIKPYLSGLPTATVTAASEPSTPPSLGTAAATASPTGSTPSSGGTMEPMKKNWLPPGMEKRRMH